MALSGAVQRPVFPIFSKGRQSDVQYAPKAVTNTWPPSDPEEKGLFARQGWNKIVYDPDGKRVLFYDRCYESRDDCLIGKVNDQFFAFRYATTP